ncbi:calvin cycle protein CP12-1, chloroplastic-like [Diospyros lotus]|uniref:calvin cycle protein CP12-1, chloroplastic-like n=1 Tax=Diospyros lotus TaxID=55363 RepID=UPI0022516064|nr:calvin cycle protein CP12-1, chloroplastic-like [Diospyros lotus]
MATINAGVSLSAPPRVLAKAPEPAKVQAIKTPWIRRSNQQFGRGLVLRLRPVKAAPEGLSEKVAESVKNAEQTCAENPESGECVAAWDEVEEVSAAASHARDRKKESDPLENYCKDNPETDECRTYDS